MSERKKLRPFTGDAEKQVRLDDPPVRLVLCQIAWPELVDFPDDLDAVAKKFGRAIADYPVFEEHAQSNILLTPAGVSEGSPEKIYQWKSADNQWCVVLGHRFLSFYRTAYTSFTDFSVRFGKVLTHLNEIVKVSALDRIGLRHVNQVADPDIVENLSDFFGAEVLGFAGSNFATDVSKLESSQNQVVVSVNNAVLHARSGILPAMQTVDQAIPLNTNRTWVLDLDSTVSQQRPFDVEDVLDVAGSLADINYDFFKYVSTDRFLERIGGNKS